MEEHLQIVKELRQHHSLFAQFWTVGTLVETDDPNIPTAAVFFDKKTGAGLQFVVNKDFWHTQNAYEKSFILSHEILHVYFEHGHRSLNLNPMLANIAQDVVINHYLVDVFGFKREKIRFADNYCWRDTVFPDRDDIEADRCFEYYYAKLEEQGGAPDGPGNQTVDIHGFMGDLDPETLDKVREAVEDMMDRITPDEVENFEDQIKKGNEDEAKQQQKVAGTMAGVMRKRVKLGRVVKKRKWEEIVRHIIGRLGGAERDLDIELWTRPNRRLSSMQGELMLPATVNETVPVHDRIDVWAFQDTSGSCKHYAERFFKAIASIPDDRFRVRVFCFDTQVYETSLKTGKLYGFGGTAFQPIEDEIQAIMRKEGCKYPQAVFLLTDGAGNSVTPQHPERWFWFLVEKCTHYIPPQSRYFDLKNYE